MINFEITRNRSIQLLRFTHESDSRSGITIMVSDDFETLTLLTDMLHIDTLEQVDSIRDIIHQATLSYLDLYESRLRGLTSSAALDKLHGQYRTYRSTEN